MYVMLRLSVPSDAFVAAATGVAQVHRPRNFCAVQSSCNHLKGVAYDAECVLRACAQYLNRTREGAVAAPPLAQAVLWSGAASVEVRARS